MRELSLPAVHSTGVIHFLPEFLADVMDQLVEQTGKDQERARGGPGAVGGVISGCAEPLEEGGIRRLFQGRPEQLSFELMQLRMHSIALWQAAERGEASGLDLCRRGFQTRANEQAENWRRIHEQASRQAWLPDRNAAGVDTLQVSVSSA
jgi:glycine/D-amino acid oxidase-like deaminating enzyme